MNVDLVALQEIRTTSEAQAAWGSVLDGITGLGGGAWSVQLQGCGAERNQHVGVLWNTTRLTLSNLADVWQFNGAATGPTQPCGGNLRPGYHAYVQPLAPGGPDFHAVVVHLDSGRSDRDFTNRRTALSRIGQATSPMRATDADIVILGDFNTMGTSGGVSAGQEITDMPLWWPPRSLIDSRWPPSARSTSTARGAGWITCWWRPAWPRSRSGAQR